LRLFIATKLNGMAITSMQLRAARALVGWTARDLALRAEVHISTVQRMEKRNGPVRGHVATLDAVIGVLHDRGIEFISEAGRMGVILKAN